MIPWRIYDPVTDIVGLADKDIQSAELADAFFILHVDIRHVYIGL